jgi:hypothetical protein
MKLVDAKGREVTNKIVSPKRRGPKQKRISNDEVSCFYNLLNLWFVLWSHLWGLIIIFT